MDPVTGQNTAFNAEPGNFRLPLPPPPAKTPPGRILTCSLRPQNPMPALGGSEISSALALSQSLGLRGTALRALKILPSSQKKELFKLGYEFTLLMGLPLSPLTLSSPFSPGKGRSRG